MIILYTSFGGVSWDMSIVICQTSRRLCWWVLKRIWKVLQGNCLTGWHCISSGNAELVHPCGSGYLYWQRSHEHLGSKSSASSASYHMFYFNFHFIFLPILPSHLNSCSHLSEFDLCFISATARWDLDMVFINISPGTSGYKGLFRAWHRRFQVIFMLLGLGIQTPELFCFLSQFI